jgi:putative SOS response-associated peptidase YedK
MCGRFASQLPAELLARLFATTNPLPNLAPNWNIAPTQTAATIRLHPQTGARHLDALTWGLVPHFTKELKSAKRPINARAETVATSPLFRSAFAARRCLVPADAFYEWQTTVAGKQPFAIARADGAPLVMAGLWEGWRSPDGEVLRSFTLLTTEANAEMARLHHRMPVILESPDWPLWLGEQPGAPATLMRPAPNGTLRTWPVSRAVNNVRNNGPELLAYESVQPPQPLTHLQKQPNV